MTSQPIVFATSNGVGMGHLTRQLTVALSGPTTWAPTLFSLSAALPTVTDALRTGALPGTHGITVTSEYCHSRLNGWKPQRGWRKPFRDRYPQYQWEEYFRDRIVALVQETHATALVFDGVVPYRGLLEARAVLPDTAFVWIRRGMWQQGVGTQWLEQSSAFDGVIEPGDFADADDNGPTAHRDDATKVAPISLTDVVDRLDRDEAREALGLPLDAKVLLVALGSGALGDISSPANRVIETVLAHDPRWRVVVTRQAIAQHAIGADSNRVTVLHDTYPLVRYLNAFDAAVSAAGYNAVHEFLPGQVATLFVPSTKHQTDDQVARAASVARQGAALTALPDDTGALVRETRSLLDDEVRTGLREASATLPAAVGGREAARLISEVAAGKALRRPAEPPPSRQRKRRVIDLRTPISTTTHASPHLVLTEDITTGDLAGRDPVEHLVENASPAYIAARRAAAEWIYRFD